VHYYRFHIGDYAKDTSHLTPIEDLAYRRLLDWYYLNEKPIDPNCIARLVRMSEYADTVNAILLEFFSQDERGFFNDRADKELAAFKAYGESRSNAAKKRWESTSNADGMHMHSTSNAINHKPITNNHKPVGNTLAAKRRTQLPADFEPDETGVSKANESGIPIAAELERFKDYHRGKGSVMLDWQAAWRTWVGNAVKFRKKGSGNGYVSAKDAERKRVIKGLTGYDADAIPSVSTRLD